MKILGISSSPHRNGITSTFVQTILEGAKAGTHKVVYHNLYDLNIQACNGCMQCRKNGAKCPINDDMQLLYKEINDSDVLVLGTPTYWANMNSKMKEFLDRSYSVLLKETKNLPKPLQKGKKAILITSCGVGPIIDKFSSQTKNSLKSMSRVAKLGGYDIVKKIKRTGAYKESQISEVKLKNLYQIGLNL